MMKNLAVLFFLLWPSLLKAEILTFFSDVGIPSDTTLFAYQDPNAPDNTIGFDGHARGVAPPEGYESFLSTKTRGGYAGWGVFYTTDSPRDFSSYRAFGEMRFWVRSSTSNVKVEVEHMAGGNPMTTLISPNLSCPNLPTWNWNRDHDQWRECRFAFSDTRFTGVDFSRIRCPFKITALAQSATFYADLVRWTQVNSRPIFNVTLKNISDNLLASQINWTDNSVSLPQQWARAEQYIQVDLDPDTYPWGLQIYTDNTASDADPKFTYVGSTSTVDPAGLVDVTTTTHVLPMAWSIKPATSTVNSNVIPPLAADPNLVCPAGGIDPNASQWLFFKDRATPNVPNSGTPCNPAGTTAFQEGDRDPFILVKSNLGIHFGQSNDNTNFGPANSPNYIYLEGNFTNAVTPRIYKSSTLRLEFYHE